jgi:hypothetical protein
MKQLYTLTFAVLISLSLFAQNRGNDWIDYSQKYLKIKVAVDGIYRIDSTTLSNAVASAGSNLSLIDPRNFQLFHNGIEEYLWIEGESDGVFNTGDYIEFAGFRNTGEMDAELYNDPDSLLNPYYSLFTDTSVYFLTWNNSTNNRRITPAQDTSFSNYSLSTSHFFNAEKFFGSHLYMPGYQDPSGITDPQFLAGEGFYFYAGGYGSPQNFGLNSQYADPSGPAAQLRFRIGTHSNDYNTANDNDIRIQFGSTVFDTIYDGFGIFTHYDSIASSALNSSMQIFNIQNVNLNSSVSSGSYAIAFITMEYPHLFNMEGRSNFQGKLQDHPTENKSRIQLNNISGSGTVRWYDFHNHTRTDGVYNGTHWEFLIPNGNGTKKPFMVFSESSTINVTSLTPVGNAGMFTDFTQFSGDSSFVIISHAKTRSVGNDYSNYRTSAAGGAHNVVHADINELYDQFSWGILFNPLAIKHFCGYLIDTFPSAPSNLFLLGKSIEGSYSRYAYSAQNLIPTFGYPASDNLLTQGLISTGWETAIATGRLAARDSAQAQWYLDKVIEYENNVPAEWMKNVLHFGGGTSIGEQSLFRNYLDGYKTIVEDTSFGGNVTSYFKTSSAPIQINQSDTLREQIENGVSIMTFFGHASGTGFDQSIDDPQNYNNFDRYPLLIANSCYAGDIHTIGVSSSEAFTLLDRKGTIGYIASVGLGVAPFLNLYTTALYSGIGNSNYGKSVGYNMRYAVMQSQAQAGNLPAMKATALEMTLQGDPSIVINSFPKPDYSIVTSDITFDEESQPDSISVFVAINNIGKAINDTMVVQLQRYLPNGDTTINYLFVAAPKYRDTVTFVIPTLIQSAVGLNKFRVTLDYFNQIDEIDNFINNKSIPEAELLIRGSAIIPVYPYNFAVIPTDTVTLKASTVNPMEPFRAWRFEIDTTDLFNSPFKIAVQTFDSGGVVRWKPNLVFTDSTVYFWRVSPDSITAGDDFLWRMHSFQYISGQTGWGQDHIYQFTDDKYQFVNLNRTARSFEFVNDVKTISVKNGVYDNVNVVWNEVWWKLNGATQHIYSCTPAFGLSGVSVAVLDPVSGTPWRHGDDSLYVYPNGVLNCVAGVPIQYLYAFDFSDMDATNRNFIRSFIDSIPNGHYVLVYSQNHHNNLSYDPALQSALGNIYTGNVSAATVPDTLPWIIFGRKGMSGGTEVIGTTATQYITFNDTMQTNWNTGYIESPLIGPAQSWGSVHWKQHEVETPDYDSVYLEVVGIRADGTSQVLLTLDETTPDYLNLNSVVNASVYPYMKLITHMKDDTSRTPPQLERWHVLFTPWPDAAINPQLAYNFYNDTLQEGDTARFIVGVENLTPWAFTDSMLVKYWIIDENNVRHDFPPVLRAPSFNGYEWYPQNINFSTEGYPGHNELWVEINPVGDTNTQPEYVHFNNIIVKPFDVSTDRVNPLLDVTFDGIHILDGDIVSGKPTILITLKDENQFLALNDTADFKVFLRYPGQTVAQLIPWGNGMEFTPAVLPDNSCKILFTPALIQDGVYELIVQAKDRSNNESGMIDYRINFEVVNKSTITNVLNYPNPFSTSTRFVFTLTGNEVPDLFTIQIMTITGKVVREIDKDELGYIHIGRNITDYAWDGMDEFGDPLANGVYLYRVITRINGDEIKHRESGADPYIINGWGKMYLMR